MTIKIMALVETALNFFVTKMGVVYQLLMANPVEAYPEVWAIVMKIFQALLGVGFTIILICTYLGVIGSFQDMIQAHKAEAILTVFLFTSIAGALITISPELLLIIVGSFQEIIGKVCGDSLIGDFKYSIPFSVTNAATDLDTLVTVLLWLLCLIGALVVVISTFSIMLIAYGRLFKMYIYIALSPLAISTFGSRHTSRIGTAFVKTFIVTCAEGVIIVISFLVFGAFTNGMQIQLDSDYTEVYNKQYEALINAGVSEEETLELLSAAYGNELEKTIAQGTIEKITGTSWDWDAYEGDAFSIVFSYIIQLSFFFLLLMSIIKGSDTEVRRIFGL